MSFRSETALKDAVFQLINHHQNIDHLLTEATSLISQDTDRHVKKEYVDIFKSCINGLEDVTDATSGFHTTETYTSKLLKIISSKSPGSNKYVTTLTQIQKDEVSIIVTAIKDMMKGQCFNKPRFLNMICKEGCLPLELLWILEVECVMSLQTYMSFQHSNTEFVKLMSEELTQTCCLTPDKLTSNYRTDMINKIVELAFPEKTDSENSSLKKIALGILDTTVRKLIDLLLSGTDKVLLPVYRGQIMNEDTVKKSYLHILSVIMRHQPVIGVFEAFKCQDKWSYAKSPSGLVEWNKLLLLPFEDREVLNIMKNTIGEQDVNWQTFLCFLSTYLICEETASGLIEGLVADLLIEGFDDSDMNKIEIGFLLSRHCCLEGPHVFMTYADWFQRVFGDSIKSPVNNRKSFTLLIRFLTDMVPVDTPEFLRAHILRPPHVPAKCRELLSDYIMLAKTRLSDLKQPFDNLGIYEDSVDPKDKQKMLDQLEQDIQKALSTFETSGKIPTTVMEASIFRKPYFVGRFLPALLKPRPLPDIADLRMKFIKALRSTDKIPVAMYNTYKTACKQEAAKLLEGVFMEIDDEDVEEEMNLEPIQQLHYRIDQLIDTVISLVIDGDPKQIKVTELVSLIREKLKIILEKQESVPPVSCDSHVIISPLTMDSDKTSIQVIDAILNLFCKLTEVCLQSQNPQFDWAFQLIDVISEFKFLHSAFFTRIWKLITEQGPMLHSHHVAGLAAVVSIVSINKEKEFGLFEVKICDGSQHLKGKWTLADHVWSYLPFLSDKWMQFTLRLTTIYLQLVFSYYDGTVLTEILQNKLPSQLVKKFVFLCWRLIPEIHESSSACSSQDTLIAHKICSSEMFKQCVELNKLSFEDWLKYELSIHPEADILREEERQEYKYWCIYNKFMKLSADDGGCCHDYRKASSILFRCILDAETSVQSNSWSECLKCKQTSKTQGSAVIKTTLIPVLQEMCCFLSVDCDREKRPSEYPWLLQQLLHIPKDDNHISYQSAVRTFSRLCTRLPSYLFYCDDLTQLDKNQSLLACNIINKHFRQYITHGCCLLANITVFLLQGLVNCCRHKNITDVLIESPLVTVSILFHIPQTTIFVDQLIKIVDDDITSTLRVLITWLQNSSSDTNLDLPDVTGPHWIIAAALFSLSVQSTRRCSEVLIRMIEKHEARTDYTEVLCVFASLMTTHISEISNSTTSQDSLPDLEDLLSMAVFECPSLLYNIITDGLSVVSQVVSDYLQKLHHYTLLKLLISKSPQKVLQLHNSINCLLLMLATVCKLYDDIGSATLERDLGDQVFSMKSLLEMSGFVKQCIMMSDAEVLSQINKEHLTTCGPDLILTVKQRLQTLS